MWKNVLCLWFFLFGMSYGFSFDQDPYFCPDPEQILPCYCNPATDIVCDDINDVEVLRRVAISMKEDTRLFNTLFLTNSSLQYLPKELLENVNVFELKLKDVTLIKMFEIPPVSLDKFQKVTFEDVKLMRGIIWTAFKNMRQLQNMVISNMSIPTLGKEFKDNVPHSLQFIDFSYTNTKKFEIGVFNDLKNLKKIDVTNSRLEELHRGNFPVPFNVHALYFGHNRIKFIPDDLFTRMPMLRDIALYDNQIATVPQSAFGGRFNKLQTFKLHDNPLKCECNLRWIVWDKPPHFDGTCASPKSMHGKELKNLIGYDFPC